MSKSLPAGRSESPVQRPNPCLLAARAPVSAKAPKSATAGGSGVSKQKQRSFQIMLAGRPGGRQAKAAGHVQITACWPVRVASAEAESVPAGGPGRQ